MPVDRQTQLAFTFASDVARQADNNLDRADNLQRHVLKSFPSAKAISGERCQSS